MEAWRSSLLSHLGEFQHILVKIREGQQALMDRALSQLGRKVAGRAHLPFFVPATFAIEQGGSIGYVDFVYALQNP